MGMASAKPEITRESAAGGFLGPLYVPPAARAPFATKPEHSRGRLYPEPESPTRTCYQRDRDRILHSTAFRRLKHKTQVFVQSEGDYYRTSFSQNLFFDVFGLDFSLKSNPIFIKSDFSERTQDYKIEKFDIFS